MLSVDEAIHAIEKFNPVNIFLDVQMPNKMVSAFKELNKINFEVLHNRSF
jgi:hypothetical protein